MIERQLICECCGIVFYEGKLPVGGVPLSNPRVVFAPFGSLLQKLVLCETCLTIILGDREPMSSLIDDVGILKGSMIFGGTGLGTKPLNNKGMLILRDGFIKKQSI